MRRESHVRFCEGGGVRLPSATRLVRSIKYECLNRVIPLGERHRRRRIAESWRIITMNGIIKVRATSCSSVPQRWACLARSAAGSGWAES
jgi:hypothetical protein